MHSHIYTHASPGDPAGANHPIHPPWKQELGRRSALAGEALVYNNSGVPPSGPLVVSAAWHPFDSSWGDFHFDSNPGGSFCNSALARGWVCGGVQVTFDRAITLANLQCTAQAYAQGVSRGGCGALGSSGGFELWNDQDGVTEQATLGPTNETLTSSLCTDCSKCPCMQPAEVWGVVPGSGNRSIQLNTTFVSGRIKTLRYAWRDYPSMSVFGQADGRPARPFKLTLQTDTT